ncbi:hypothetical protein AB1Y20_018204 [Prymnesium parvum]|uniref:Enoyl-CoA hydratase/isomerase family protein n=1 Tax=Prymnesium parvum TaxID=97485 RepID=A0AB34JRL1_PRYPA
MADLLPAGHDGVTLSCDESGVLTLSLDRGENRVDKAMVDALTAALTIVESRPHPKALLVTSGGEKFFMNGLDLQWMSEHAEQAISVLEGFWRLLARLLTLDCHTVAAVNGHAFGAGVFLALACDWRLMRTRRGFLCFPELNLGMRLSKGFAELSKAKLAPATLREAVLTGKRYGSAAALAAGLIDGECAIEELHAEATRCCISMLPGSLKLARFDPTALHTMKVELYTDAFRALSSGLTQADPMSRL